jgi:hypothetical protein
VTVDTFIVSVEGGFLKRGFWLYVWEATCPDGRKLVYVGRTGDSSSPNAQSPFVRMGQHLGHAPNSNMLRKHLERHDVQPETCSFRIIAHGPILPQAVGGMDAHTGPRDVIAAMEKQLAEDLAAAGYEVMNDVKCRKPLDEAAYSEVRRAFAVELPELQSAGG